MQISCKCLNFIASSNSQASGGAAVGTAAAVATADAAPTPASVGTQPAGAPHADDDCSMSAGYVGINAPNNLPAALMHAFLQKYPRNFIFYSQCMDFFKQAVGPVPDLTINAVNQRDLVYSLTLDVLQAQTPQSWQLSICANCNVALCAKRLQPAAPGFAAATNHPPQFLINCSLLMNNEELAHRRAEKSFSDTFGLLIMDHPQLDAQQQQNGATAPTTPMSFTVGSLSNASNLTLDSKQQRQRQLQQYLQQRLKREIAETDERILRYTEQQFALLKSFREKAEQEYALLVRLIQRVPEQQAAELLDRAPPALEVTGSVGYAARRRNTIGSWRDMNATTPTTPTTPNPTTTAGMLTLPLAGAAATATAPTASAMDANTQGATVLATTIIGSSGANRKLSNFDTPPATPEATPMSVGNSPTFRQQQLTQPFVRIASNSFQQQFPTPSSDPGDDCLFELEGVDSGVAPPTSYNTLVSNITLKLPYHQQQQQHYPRTFTSHHHHHHHEKNMSDLDESDDAEEAEVALDLDSSMPIPMRNRAMASDRHATAAAAAATADMLNFAKSLPIEIASSPMNSRSYIGESEEDELDNNVDIAASIKALAKSVHGEAVFGDLPRPRLRSQI